MSVRTVLSRLEGDFGDLLQRHERARDRPLVVVRSANAVGKDRAAARLALWSGNSP